MVKNGNYGDIKATVRLPFFFILKIPLFLIMKINL
jgi:hypothetical protein